MRHGVKLNRLGRTSSHRKALMSNMASQLIQYKRIVTTLAKAKALRVYVEPLLTKSKTDDTHNRRLVFAKLQNKEAIIELFSTISEKIAARPGGYTRIIKLEPRVGDAAEMAMIELVDFNTIYNNKPEVAVEKKKTRRSKGATTTEAKAPKASKVVAEEAAPIVEEAAPIVEEAAPIVEEAAPIVEEAAPIVEEAAPIAEEAALIVEEAAPIVEEAAPIVEEAAPIVEEAAPIVEEAAPIVEEAAEEAAPVAETTIAADDLKIVEGIGPKIADLFIAKGITTFAQLANTSVEDMKAILEEAGPAYAGKDPGTWAQQSQMAADGKWDELKTWQDELNGGKA
jgi:large subunit ribosomal protein L17